MGEGPGEVLVVGERPSLGHAIADLLESEGFRPQFTLDAASEGNPVDLRNRFYAIIVASPGYYCGTARRWVRGEFPGLALIVVASQDPFLDSVHGIHRVALPLDPDELVHVVRSVRPLPDSAARAGEGVGEGESDSAPGPDEGSAPADRGHSNLSAPIGFAHRATGTASRPDDR